MRIICKRCGEEPNYRNQCLCMDKDWKGDWVDLDERPGGDPTFIESALMICGLITCMYWIVFICIWIFK